MRRLENGIEVNGKVWFQTGSASEEPNGTDYVTEGSTVVLTHVIGTDGKWERWDISASARTPELVMSQVKLAARHAEEL